MNPVSIRIAFQHVQPAIKVLTRRGKILFSQKYLLYTNTGISIFVSTSSDLVNQKYQISQKDIDKVDLKRSRDVAISGSFIGPFCHFWYMYLDKWFPGRSAKIIAKKLVVDQFVCSPVVIGLYLGITSYMENKTLVEIKKECADKSWKLFIAEVLVWPPAQIFNFYFLPTRYRVLFDNFVSALFDFYFSRVKYGNVDKEESIRNLPIT